MSKGKINVSERMEVVKKRSKEDIKKFKERKKHVEALLREDLKKNLTQANIGMIQNRIRGLSSIMIFLKMHRLFSQYKSMEAFKMVSSITLYKKYEKQIRQKFNVPASIPILFKR